MSRWEPDAPGRLRRAALELYVEKGFETTTAAEIAERAGLNRRTFFRHFADKREVLFWGSGLLGERCAAAIDEAEPQTPPFEMALIGLRAVAPLFDERRPDVLLRQRVIDATPELQERERTKRSQLADVIADALHRKGADANAARVAAEIGVAILHVTFQRWVEASNTKSWNGQLDDTVAEVGRLIPRSS
jgi:AcrR family transcriptional regulator